MSARIVNKARRRKAAPPEARCGMLMISEGGWLAPCILAPQHAARHLPSPYLKEI